ncbi:MAG TPA: AarF/UbiB family protein, partial [Streptosporangiaceae bacterium]|nr:AarF/UbiB family protein [Streptosporangiaceae bacterium]
RFLFSGPARAGLLHADPHPGNFRLLADGRLGVLDFGAVDRLPGGLPPFMGRLLRIVHEGTELGPAEQELREQGFIREGIEFDPEALRAFLAPLAEPSRVERFRFSREWLRGEATRVADPRAANVSRRLNLPPSYVLIHRVSTAGMGVLCQLECEGPYRAEMIRWMPGYSDADRPADRRAAAAVTAGEVTAREVTAREVTAGEVTGGEVTAAGLIVDGLAAGEMTTAEELTAGGLAASGLIDGLSPNGLTANGLPANGLSAQELTAGELTAGELTNGQLTTGDLTAGQPAADAAAGPGEPDPVGPAR